MVQDPPGCELSKLAYRDFLKGLEEVGQSKDVDCGRKGEDKRKAEWERIIVKRKNALKGALERDVLRDVWTESTAASLKRNRRDVKKKRNRI
jgi:hypothetical protein